MSAWFPRWQQQQQKNTFEKLSSNFPFQKSSGGYLTPPNEYEHFMLVLVCSAGTE